MAVHRLITLQIILLLWLIKASGQQLCRDRCGSVSISYPFGIGKGCYFDKTYEVICSNSSGSEIAFLNSIKLELSSVGHLTSEIGVSISVISLNSSNSTSNAKSVNLSGTPFSFSNNTRFTAIGCEDLSMINNLNNNDSKSSGACLSICSCDPSQSRHAGCCDLSCTITPNSKVFDANTVYNYSQSIPQSCKSVSMVYQGWLFSRYQTNSSGLRDEEQLPAMLKWGRIKGKCQVDFNSHSKSCNSDNYCLIQLGSGHFCLCDTPRAASYQHICQGDLICNTTSGYNCSQCPFDNYQSPSVSDQGSCSSRMTSRIVDPYVEISVAAAIVRGCIIGGLGVLFLIFVTWRLYIFVKRRREMRLKQNFFKRNGGLLLQQELSSNEGNIDKTKVFTSKELERATDNFNANRILGQGGQGTVYKGMLVDGRIVAVKKSKVVVESKVEEFINEVVILSQINHRNVIKLLGCCLETQVPLLVYEFVSNGTLFEYIHDQNQEFPITWEMRLRIAVEVSDALSYLHSAASIPIYHRDIKSTNILLDDKYRAKVSDFGTSRSMPVDHTHLTTQVQGTFGYLDPEYFRSSQFTDKSDVYSFGVVLAELLTGEKAIRSINSEENRSLAAYFLSAMKENRLFEILDDHVLKEGEKNEIITVAKLAKRCLNLNGKKRPTMRELAIELASIRAWNNGASMKEESLEEIVSAEEDIASRHFNAGSSVTGSDSATFSMDFDPLISNKWG